MKLTITKVSRYTTNKDGQPLVSPFNGEMQASIVIETKEEGRLSGFCDINSPANQWKEGDVVELEITTKGQYKNWKFPRVAHSVGVYAKREPQAPVSTQNLAEARFSAIERRLEALERSINLGDTPIY